MVDGFCYMLGSNYSLTIAGKFLLERERREEEIIFCNFVVKIIGP